MNYEILGLVLAALLFISGGIGTLYKMMNAMRKEREEENAATLKRSTVYTDQKFDFLQKELGYQKELYEGKISELAQKIDDLTKETRRHHTQLVDLLTKMIDKP